jgi:hypothetical protein
MAEAVKVALIRDAVFFDWLEANAEALRNCESAAMRHMIRRCAELHMQQIGQGGDPFETGSARPLDYGHWSRAQAGVADQPRTAPRRGGGHRPGAGHPLLGADRHAGGRVARSGCTAC